jgi:hypothetical protein
MGDTMTSRFGMLLALVVGTAVITACGGGTPSSVAPAATSGAGGGAATAAPAATAGGGGGGAATAAPAATAAAGGGASLNVCDLVPVQAAAAAMGTAALTATGSGTDPAKCSYTLADGEEALSIDILRTGAEAQFQSFIANGSAEEVSGIGDKALWESGTRRLLFIKNGLLVYVFPRYVNGADLAFEAAKAIATAAAGHL